MCAYSAYVHVCACMLVHARTCRYMYVYIYVYMLCVNICTHVWVNVCAGVHLWGEGEGGHSPQPPPCYNIAPPPLPLKYCIISIIVLPLPLTSCIAHLNF